MTPHAAQIPLLETAEGEFLIWRTPAAAPDARAPMMRAGTAAAGRNPVVCAATDIAQLYQEFARACDVRRPG
jgi:hypothetical protein